MKYKEFVIANGNRALVFRPTEDGLLVTFEVSGVSAQRLLELTPANLFKLQIKLSVAEVDCEDVPQ